MKHAVALIAVLLLAGCAGGGFGLVKTTEISVQTIYWVKQAPGDCAYAKAPHGCARREPTGCQITMPENAPDWVVAHEFRHCFGYSHE